MFGVIFDTALGLAGREASGGLPSATVQLTVNFLDALKVGEFATVRCQVVRATGSLIFLRGAMTAGGRVVATADGVWKILRSAGSPALSRPDLDKRINPATADQSAARPAWALA